MAAKYRRIDPRIWTDEKFRKLTLEGQHLALWLLTTSRLNRCGIVLWSPGLASEETKIPRNRIDTVLDTVCHTLFWIRDTASDTVFFPRWWYYNKPDNAKALKGALADLHDVPTTTLKLYLASGCDGLHPPLDTVWHTVLDTVLHTVSPQEQEQEQEQEYIKGPVSVLKRASFRHPTLEEVASYCAERRNQVDPQQFLDYYTANGWRVGKSPMKDWRAAVRNWERRAFDRRIPEASVQLLRDNGDPCPDLTGRAAT